VTSLISGDVDFEPVSTLKTDIFEPSRVKFMFGILIRLWRKFQRSCERATFSDFAW